MTVVIGTAGHIDHGKTSLLRALTGIDADRLPEERARGMTIDVGYAHLELADGSSLDFVDVPGHDKLVGNMLVGAGEVDAALLVVAADDGPRAQTHEHLELLDALGIRAGLAVVTKIDAVEPKRVDEVVAAVEAVLAGTSLAGAPVLAASSVSGAGIEAVRAALGAVRDKVLSERAAEAVRALPPRLAIDRVFSVRGRGTVVTGTLRGGPIARGAVLRVVRDTAAATVRVREVQVHNRTVDEAGPGRTALNVALAGSGARLDRGVVLTADPGVVATDRLLVATRPRLPDRTPVIAHIGTARAAGVIAATPRDAVELGEGWGSAILRLERPVAVAAGDRFVLRRPSPASTLAGGRALDPVPARGAARRRATPSRIRALAGAPPGSEAWTAARLDLQGAIAGSPELAPDVAGTLETQLVDAVTSRASIPAAELVRLGSATVRRKLGAVDGLDRAVAVRVEALVSSGRLARRGGSIEPAGAEPERPSPEVAAAMDRLVGALSVASPPPLGQALAATGCPPDAARTLERDGRIVRLDDDLAWSSATYAELTALALELAAREPLTPAALRDATGSSRKYVMAILEDLDRRAILSRTPAGHVPGPRAGTAPALTKAEP
jgi:selenocysteine-specific elongation factor